MNGKIAPRSTPLFILTCLLLLATACSGRADALPVTGQEELQHRIEEFAAGSVSYEISSIQKAPGYSDTEVNTDRTFTGSSNQISGCPQDNGGREMWCVVLDREITSPSGAPYSHFLVQRLGGIWNVSELGDSEMDRFTDVGCQNWNATTANQTSQ